MKIMTIMGVFRIKQKGTVLTGYLEEDVKIGDKLIVAGKEQVLASIEMYGKTLERAHRGAGCGLFFRCIEDLSHVRVEDEIHRD